MLLTFRKIVILLVFTGTATFSFSQQWEVQKAPLMSKFSKDVNLNKVLQEYPRPQMVRAKWMNLNGLWQYQPGVSDEALPTGKLSKTILVPFPVESALSGVREHHDRLWYRHNFTIPKNWKGERVLLHFGAVDFESEIYVNGKSLGIYRGGYDPFTFYITLALTASGEQELTVLVFDPTDNGGFPRGKQTLTPQGIMYTSVTGIWQTVWLEPVAKTSIDNIKIVPDIDKSVVKLTVYTEGNTNGASVAIKVKEGDKTVTAISIQPNVETSIPVANAKFWSPDHPFLYNLDISLNKGGVNADPVSSYFGMRKISVENDGGF